MDVHTAALAGSGESAEGAGVEFASLTNTVTDDLAALQLALQLPSFMAAVHNAMHGRVPGVAAEAVIAQCATVIRCCTDTMAHPQVLHESLTKTA